jgi:DNA-directed RNA polymerase subunit beta'
MGKIITTAGQLLINKSLPGPLRDYKRVLDKKGLKSLLQDVARKHPTEYSNVMMGLKDVGQRSAYLKASNMTIADFDSPFDQAKFIDEHVKKMPANMTDAEVAKRFSELQKKVDKKTLEMSLKRGNNLARQIAAGARGTPAQLSSTISTPVLYADYKGSPIRVPIKHSFSEGLDAVELFSSAPGTRQGVISTKLATPEGGFFGKQLSYVAGNLLVTEEDCGTNNGTESNTDDSDNIGRLLARNYGPYKRNTIISPELLSRLKRVTKSILIRSPISCEAEDGVCKKCRGFTEQGALPALGDNVGQNSAHALSESATQAAMKVKHTGGQVASAGQGRAFDVIRQLVKVPKTFRGGAVVSERDGKVDNIEKAHQGGHYIDVAGTKHYVLPDYDLLVRKGAIIEAGQPLSTGIVNPSDVARLRGLGEGRKFLSDSLRATFLADGQKVNKVHMESLAKSLLTYMRVDDDKFLDDHVPGDVITDTKAQKYYNPKSVVSPTKKAVGRYLAKPYMHLEAGVKIKPTMAKALNDHGYKDIEVTDEPAPFSPIMVRLDDAPSYKPNWVARLYSTQLKKKLLGATQQAEKAPIHGKEWVPSFIVGQRFGRPKVKY